MLSRIFNQRERRLLLQLVVVSAILGAAAVAGAATTGVFSGSTEVSAQPSFSVLSGPTTPLSAGSPILQHVGGASGVQAHLALDSGGLQLLAVTSSDGQFLCLTVRLPDGTSDTCRQRRGLRGDDVIWISRANADGVHDVFGLAPDGITSVRAGDASVKPANSAFVVSNIPASVSDLTIDGPGIHRNLSLGAQGAVPTTTIGD